MQENLLLVIQAPHLDETTTVMTHMRGVEDLTETQLLLDRSTLINNYPDHLAPTPLTEMLNPDGLIPKED